MIQSGGVLWGWQQRQGPSRTWAWHLRIGASRKAGKSDDTRSCVVIMAARPGLFPAPLFRLLQPTREPQNGVPDNVNPDKLPVAAPSVADRLVRRSPRGTGPRSAAGMDGDETVWSPKSCRCEVTENGSG